MTAREAALDVLLDVYRKHAYVNLALKKVRLQDDREQRFATALVNAALENYLLIDHILSRFLNPKKTDETALCICRLGVAQIIGMDGVPDRAAVSATVELAKKRRPGLRGFVNAVLRNVLRCGDDFHLPSSEQDPVGYLSVRYSYPSWICRLFIEQRGFDAAQKLLSYKAKTDLTAVRLVKPLPDREDLLPGIYLDDCAYIKSMRRIDSDSDYICGALTVQSEASMLCVRAAGIQEDARILDLCAAPGGKSAYAAQIARRGHVTACDLHENRVKLIRQTARRLGATNLTACAHDAREPNEAWKEQFDVVLVDAPCSALGLLSRKPDVKMFKREEDLKSLSAVQKEILNRAADYVRPGGTLLYSTCTMDRLENEDVVRSLLEDRADYRLDSLTPVLPGSFAERGAGGQLQLMPPEDDVDGFYMARMARA